MNRFEHMTEPNPPNLLPTEPARRNRAHFFIDVTKEYHLGEDTSRPQRHHPHPLQEANTSPSWSPLRLSGKSTLFNAIGGLDKPTSGKVYIDEVDASPSSTPSNSPWLRCLQVGYIFQTFNLIPVMTALENVALPMIFAGMSNAL